MAVNLDAREALDPAELELPAKPTVEAIEPESYEDSTGEEALQVWVLLSDSTEDDELTGEHVMQIKSAIRERLLSRGIHLFPYVRMVKRSDYRPAGQSS